MKREDFLRIVRDAARAGRAYPVGVADVAEAITDTTGYVGGGARPAQTLCDQVNAVGGQAELTTSWEQARSAIERILTEHRPRSALCWEHPLLDRLQLDDILRRLDVVRWGHSQLAALSAVERRRTMLAAEIGISSVTAAVAETGTMALGAAEGRERSASLLPPVYLTLVHASQIVPDLFDFFAGLMRDGAEALPSQYALVTGPSKTGDIELQLTTGVHGPRIWQVVVVETNDDALTYLPSEVDRRMI